MEKDDLINQYFEKTLSTENQKKFDNLLLKDAEFANEIAFQNNLKKALTLNERNNLKQKLKGFESEKTSRKYFKWNYIATSAAIVLGGLLVFNQGSSPEKLYQQYYQTYPNTVAPAVRGLDSNDIKTNAFFAYDSGNFEKAHQLFTEIYTAEKTDYALFYSSLSLIELGEHQQAIAAFNRFDLLKNTGFTPFIKWFKALSYLKLDQKDKALPLLKELATTQNPQRDIAQRLLQDF